MAILMKLQRLTPVFTLQALQRKFIVKQAADELTIEIEIKIRNFEGYFLSLAETSYRLMLT